MEAKSPPRNEREAKGKTTKNGTIGTRRTTNNRTKKKKERPGALWQPPGDEPSDPGGGRRRVILSHKSLLGGVPCLVQHYG